MVKNKNLFISYLSLFTSFGTIICCALPSLLVSIGMGAAFAGLLDLLPQIIWLSENKVIVFTTTGIIILSSFFAAYLNRNAPCPIDNHLAKACRASRKWSIIITIISGFVWLIGFYFSFLAVLFL